MADSNRWNLVERINKLPAYLIPKVQREVIERADSSQPTYSRVLNGKSKNFDLIQALAQVLCCSMEEVADPNYQFDRTAIEEYLLNLQDATMRPENV
jgi:hypothetical protein